MPLTGVMKAHSIRFSGHLVYAMETVNFNRSFQFEGFLTARWPYKARLDVIKHLQFELNWARKSNSTC